MADASSSGQGHGGMGLKVGRNSIPDTTSMTAFLDNTDLMSHMFGFITKKENKQSATLVCKGWRELSDTFPTWRKAILNIKYEDGPCLQRIEKQNREPYWEASMSAIEGMLTHRKHITQYSFYYEYRSINWWADLATFMPHLTWLSLCVGKEVDGVVETPFALKGLPNLTHLYLYAAFKHVARYGEYPLSSLSLWLPALQTLELDEHMDKNFAKEVCELDFECPSLVSFCGTIHAELSMSTAWFAHLRSLDLTLHDVPEVMKRSDDEQEWVLDTCPQLVSLKIFLMCLRDEDDENDDDHDGIIRSITLDLPSLEKFCLRFAHTVKKCTLTCPKLVDIELMDCWRMVTLKFDGGARLHRLDGGSRSTSSSSCIADH